MKLTKKELEKVRNVLAKAQGEIEAMRAEVDRLLAAMKRTADAEHLCVLMSWKMEYLDCLDTLKGQLVEDWSCDERRPSGFGSGRWFAGEWDPDVVTERRAGDGGMSVADRDEAAAFWLGSTKADG